MTTRRTLRRDGRWGVRRVPLGLLVPALAALLLVGLTVAVSIGPVPVPAADVWSALATRLGGIGDVPPSERIVTELRAPRAVLAAVVGATLALVGAVLQAVVRNPLADPAILGGTSGAGLGAVLVIVGGAGGLLGTATLTMAAFVGAAGGFALAFALAWRAGGLTPLRLVLAGVAVSYLLSALTHLAVVRAGDDAELRSAVFWQLGSVAAARWGSLPVPVTLLVAGSALLVLRARRLDALAVGEHAAASLGVDPRRLRLELFVLVALLTGAAVAVAGGIGFVALVVPHAVRLLVGPLHRRLLPLTVLTGAVFLVWADVAARVVAPPAEVPIGVVTALVGAPVFALLVNRRLREPS